MNELLRILNKMYPKRICYRCKYHAYSYGYRCNYGSFGIYEGNPNKPVCREYDEYE